MAIRVYLVDDHALVRAGMRMILAGEVKDGELVSAEQAKTIETFKSDLLSARAELREVQYNLRADVARLKNWIMVLIIGVVPAAVALIALVFALRRPRRPVPVRKA